MYIFACTTTTRFENYKDKADVCVRFEYSKELFTQPCLICLDDMFAGMTVQEFESYKPFFVGSVDAVKIREIKMKLEKADIPPVARRDILASFTRDGF